MGCDQDSQSAMCQAGGKTWSVRLAPAEISGKQFAETIPAGLHIPAIAPRDIAGIKAYLSECERLRKRITATLNQMQAASGGWDRSGIRRMVC